MPLVLQRWPSALRLDDADVGLIAAMTLGERDLLRPEQKTEFQRIGAFHLLVVSGLSVAIVAAFVYWLLRLARIERVVATLITLPVLVCYALMTGFAVPVERALLMTALYMLANAFMRGRSWLNALGFAALGILLVAPDALFSVSLQMSLLAVMSITGIAVPLLESTLSPYTRGLKELSIIRKDPSFPPKVAQFRVVLRLFAHHLRKFFPLSAARAIVHAALWLWLNFLRLAVVSLILELSLAVPMAVYFHRVTTLSLPANIFTVSLLGILLPLSLVMLASAWISTSIAAIPAAAVALVLHLTAGFVRLLAHLRAAEMRVPPSAPTACLLALACLVTAVLLAYRPVRKFTFAALAATAACGLLALWPVPLHHHPGALEVTALDVGQGDSILVVTPSGRTLLIDSGGPVGIPGLGHSRIICGSAASGISTQSRSPTRTAITWAACPSYSPTFIRRCCGSETIRPSRHTAH
jgi:competence protein ComEC